MPAVNRYWEGRYSDLEGVQHHAAQNFRISRDFLRAVRRRQPVFQQALRRADSILELGCGTGELAAMVARQYHPRVLFATDFAEMAIRAASTLHPEVRFDRFDILRDWPTPLGGFELAIASNTLEHFRDPHLVLSRMLELAQQAIILVPYRQPVTDGYDAEGGPGHAFRFTRETFRRYRTLASFTFATDGWQHRSADEEPLQLAVLLEPK